MAQQEGNIFYLNKKEWVGFLEAARLNDIENKFRVHAYKIYKLVRNLNENGDK